MKKKLTFALIVISVLLLSACSFVAEKEETVFFEFASGSTNAEVTSESVLPSDGVVEFPSEINGVAVTGIEEGGLNQLTSSVRTLVIPSCIGTINYGTFDSCEELVSVTFLCPGITINNGAFTNCPKLEKVYVTGTTENISSNAFQGHNLSDLVNSFE